MLRLLLCLTLVGSVVSSVIPASTFLTGVSSENMAAIDQALKADCGDACVNRWHEMLSTHGGQGKNLVDAVKSMAGDTMKQMEDFKKALASGDVKLSSFLAAQEGSGMAPIDVPCDGPTTCKIVELLANSCNFPRLAAMAVYQGLNLAVHIFAIVTKVLCACIDVFTFSKCILAGAFPPCIALDPVFRQMFAASTQVWEAVKKTTAVCKTVGDVRTLYV